MVLGTSGVGEVVRILAHVMEVGGRGGGLTLAVEGGTNECMRSRREITPPYRPPRKRGSLESEEIVELKRSR